MSTSNDEKLKLVYDLMNEMNDHSLLKISQAITDKFLADKEAADMRAVDFESGIANLLRRKVIKIDTYKFVLQRFVLPHKRWLRAPWIVEQLKERARTTEPLDGEEQKQ